MNGDTKAKPDRGPLIAGIVFIVVGCFLLLERMGYLPRGFLLHSWPSIFILVGASKLAYAAGRSTGAVLVMLGVLLELNTLGITHWRFSEMWPVFIIITGVAMLWQAMGGGKQAVSGNPRFDAFYIFGGGDRRVSSKNFQGANLLAIFGGYKLDLTQAEFAGGEAVIEANAVFGGGEIHVPEDCLVFLKGMALFGAYEDKTRRFQTDASKPSQTLVVRGMALFGGIVVKN